MSIVDVRQQMLVNADPALKYKHRSTKDIKQIIIHCDDWHTDYQTVNAYDIGTQCHVNPGKGCPGFTYTYFIMDDGTTYHCMDLEEVTWHAGMHNWESMAVCLSYRATGNKNTPPFIQMSALYELIANLCLQLHITPDHVLGHRELLGTGYILDHGIKKLRKECPGILINLDMVRAEITKRLQTILAQKKLYNGKIDGIFGPKTKMAFLLA
jgi:hypothetical protein